MIVYRIAAKQYAGDLSGIGALLYGGRWNPKGIAMLYTSSSISLAMLEILAHSSRIKLKNEMFLAEIEIITDDESMMYLKELAEGWDHFPFKNDTIQRGKTFLKSTYLCCSVPSAIVPDERNILINPNHAEFLEKVKINDLRPIIFNNRILP